MLIINNLVKEYYCASVTRRIELILKYYPRIDGIIRIYESGLFSEIKDEREARIREMCSDPGVRIQSSNIGNPTQTEAELNQEIATAIRCGDYRTALRDTENYERHKMGILTLKNMRDDYKVVTDIVKCFGRDDDGLYESYLMKKKDLFSIAEEQGVGIDAIKKRFSKSKKEVIINSENFILGNKGILRRCA